MCRRVESSALVHAGGGARSVAGQRPPAWPWDRHSDIAWHGEAATSGDGDAASARTPMSMQSPRHQLTEASMVRFRMPGRREPDRATSSFAGSLMDMVPST